MTDDSEQTPSNAETPNAGAWGSDIIAEALREQDIPYACIVPGASFRGLHDSLVNHLGNQAPRMLLCLHEEHTLSIAHGWAQVTNEPLAAILHTNVGLMHATMTMFNVWCDRMPALVLGASGPHDAEKRRPWIDWIHSATDLGALVRDYTKWDDAPGSAAATVDAIRRGGMIARTSPMGPVYINMDIAVQEEWVDQRPALHDLSNYRPPAPPAPPPADVDRAFEMLRDASAPVILVGRVTRAAEAWADRVRLAEMFNAPVYSIYNAGGGFPKSHPLHHGVVQLTLDDQTCDGLARADVVLALDWTDLGGTVEQVWPRGSDLPAIINVSDDFHLHRGWSLDYHRLQPAALRIGTAPEPLVASLLARAEKAGLAPRFDASAPPHTWHHAPAPTGEIGLRDLAAVFNELTAADKVTLVSRPIGWPHQGIRVEHPLDFLGSKGGEGLGAGPGMLVGAALAIRDHHPDRICVSVLGDGDFLMGASAIWTAAAEGIPMLGIIANNRSYYNDVVHQERVAIRRDRPVANKWIGMQIDNPAPDLAAHAISLGVEAAGPIRTIEQLRPALAHALDRLRQGVPYILDVQVSGGYVSGIAGKT